MDYDKALKADDMVLALLWLTTFGEKTAGRLSELGKVTIGMR